jgi:hypothetical protein
VVGGAQDLAVEEGMGRDMPRDERNDPAAEHVVISVDGAGEASSTTASKILGTPVPAAPATTGSVRIDDRRDRRRAGEARQEHEADELGSALPAGVVTRGQARGALWGGLIGLVIGAVLIAPLGFIPLQDVDLWPRLGLAAAVGGIAGLVAGVVFGGGWESDREEHPRQRATRLVVGYHASEDDDPTPRDPTS